MLTKKVHHYIRQHSMWKPKDVILVSVSGGVDSMTLLHVLYHTRSMHKGILKVVTFDHGLRDESKDEVEMVSAFCRQYNIPCQTILYLENTKFNGDGTRGTTYAFGSIDSFNCNWTSYERPSRLSSVSFARGSGLDGASGMLPVRENIVDPC